MLRMGLIGLGTHGLHAVLPGIQASQSWKVVAVADPDPARLAMVEDTSIRRYADAYAMIKDGNLDGVYVATLLELHAPITLAALQAGLHVVCEKPMAESAEICRQMVQTAEQANRMLVVTFESRYQPHLVTMRQWVEQGKLGDVQAIHLQHFWDGHKSTGPLSERRARLMDRAGALDCGIHKLDLARYLTGCNEWTRIEAFGAAIGESFQYPSHLSILGQLDHKVMVTVNVSMAYAAHIAPRPMQDQVTIVGTQGVASYSVDADSPQTYSRTHVKVSCYSHAGVEQVPIEHLSHLDAIARMLDQMHQAITDPASYKPGILPTGHDGLQAQIATEWAHNQAAKAAERSAREREAIGVAAAMKA